MTRTMHMGVAKRYLLRVVADDSNWRDWIPAWEGTREDALQAIREDPRAVFAPCDCEKDEDGACTGKPRIAPRINGPIASERSGQ